MTTEIEERLRGVEQLTSQNAAALNRVGQEVREHGVRIKDLSTSLGQHALDIQKGDFKNTLVEQIAGHTREAFDQHELEFRRHIESIHESLKCIELTQVKQNSSFIRYAFIAWSTLAMTVGGGLMTFVWALVTGRVHAFFGL